MFKKALCDYISSGGAVAEWVRELAWTGDLTVPAGSNPFYLALPVYFGGDIKSHRSLLCGVYGHGK